MFETTDAALRGAFTITTTLVGTNGGTDVTVRYEGLPRGVPVADNETGTRMALAKLAALVEAGWRCACDHAWIWSRCGQLVHTICRGYVGTQSNIEMGTWRA